MYLERGHLASLIFMANNISDFIIGKTVKTVLAIFTVTILTLTFGCNSDDPSAEDLMPTYSIDGTISKSDGGAASGASVQLQNAVDGSNLGQTTAMLLVRMPFRDFRLARIKLL